MFTRLAVRNMHTVSENPQGKTVHFLFPSYHHLALLFSTNFILKIYLYTNILSNAPLANSQEINGRAQVHRSDSSCTLLSHTVVSTAGSRRLPRPHRNCSNFWPKLDPGFFWSTWRQVVLKAGVSCWRRWHLAFVHRCLLWLVLFFVCRGRPRFTPLWFRVPNFAVVIAVGYYRHAVFTLLLCCG